MNRFRPTVTAFEDRLNLSPLAPIDSFESSIPATSRSEPLPVLLVIANRDFYFDDGIDLRITTGQSAEFHPLPKPIRLLDTRIGESAHGLANSDGRETNGIIMSDADVDQAAGRRTYEPITIAKRVDRSSP